MLQVSFLRKAGFSLDCLNIFTTGCSLLHGVVLTVNSSSFLHLFQLSRISIRDNLSEVLPSVRFVCRLFSFAMCGGLSYSGIDLLNC